MGSPDARLERIRLLKTGKHASAQDITNDPVATYFLEPRNGFSITTDQETVERDLVRGDNENYSSLNGAKASGITFDLEARGLLNGAGDGVAADYATNSQVGTLLDCICGAVGTNNTGQLSAAAGSSGTTIETDDTTASDGNAIMVAGVSSGVLQAREVVSGGGTTTLIVPRSLVDDTGTVAALEDAAVSSVVYASSTWDLTPSNANHLHAWFEAEGDSFARKFFGCMSNAKLTIDAGGLCLWGFEFQGTNWTDVAGGLTFAAQNAGEPTLGLDVKFMIGDSLTAPNGRWDLIEGSVDFGMTMSPKASLDADNGLAGFKVLGFDPTITAKFYFNEDLFNGLQEATTRDISLQIGQQAGSAYLFRMPNADAREVKHTVTDGIETIDCTFHATRPTAGSGSMRIHMF
jgi:hypothetical protein